MDRPNILVFMTDHQRRESMPGYNWCITPNMTRFAEESTVFTNAVCPSPHCCPSRAAFFSGLFPSESGVWNNVNVGNTLSKGLTKGVRLWSEDLKDNGYDLFYSGKWHVSAEEGPANRGFTELFLWEKFDGIHMADEDRQPVTYEWESFYSGKKMSDPARNRRDGEILRNGYPEYFLYGESDHPFHDREVIDAAVTQLKNMNGTKPWCMYVGCLGPHDPYKLPQKYLDMYDIDSLTLPDSFEDDMLDKPALYRRTRLPYSQLSKQEHLEALRHYLAFCTYEDALFGELLDAVHENGFDENTVIIYLSDHGDYAGAHGLWAKGLPCFKEAYAIPLMIHVPNGKANRTNVPVMLTDLAPTILDFAGVNVERRFAGISLADAVYGNKIPERKYRFTQTNGNELYGIQRSVFSDKWKYVYNGFDFDELYDLENDPEELHNLINDPKYSSIVYELSKEMWKFAKENHDTIVNPYIMTALAPFGPAIIL